MTIDHNHIMLTSAAHGLIGYCSSVKEGDVVTEGYVARLNEHYIPNLVTAIEAYEQAKKPRIDAPDILELMQEEFVDAYKRVYFKDPQGSHKTAIEAVYKAISPFLHKPELVDFECACGHKWTEATLLFKCEKCNPKQQPSSTTALVQKLVGALQEVRYAAGLGIAVYKPSLRSVCEEALAEAEAWLQQGKPAEGDNLELAYRMLSEIELTPDVPMSVRAAISGFLHNRYYFNHPTTSQQEARE